MEMILGALLKAVGLALITFGVVLLIGLGVIFVLWYLERGGRR